MSEPEINKENFLTPNLMTHYDNMKEYYLLNAPEQALGLEFTMRAFVYSDHTGDKFMQEISSPERQGLGS